MKLAADQSYQNRRDDVLDRVRKYQEDNKPRLQVYRANYRKKNAAKLKKKKAAGYQKNKAKQVARNRLDRQRNPERYKAYSQKWLENNPEVRRASKQNNKIKRRSRPGFCSADAWKAKCEYYGWRCYLCGISVTSETMHMEHRIPLSRGGTHWPANLAPACATCNLAKSNRTEKEYRELMRLQTPA